jgi:hypothetical protein
VDVGVLSDISLDNIRGPVTAIGSVGSSSRGFAISSDFDSPTDRLIFICRDYPLVTDVSTYWYGSSSSASADLFQEWPLHGKIFQFPRMEMRRGQ